MTRGAQVHAVLFFFFNATFTLYHTSLSLEAKLHFLPIFFSLSKTVIGTWLLCRAVLVSTAQQGESAMPLLSLPSLSALGEPVDCSTPGPPGPHHLLKSAQVHVHCIGEATQASHPLMPSSPPALNLSQHQGLFQ